MAGLSIKQWGVKMKSLLTIVAMATIITGCSTYKTLTATGGSRSDGVVELSYQYAYFQKPIVEWGQALITATQRCKAWGYYGAERFDSYSTQCQKRDVLFNCMSQHVTITYQCKARGIS